MPLVARCLALQWCAESSGAEISAATRRYQRETSFVNSSPTVSRLHSWLTALCVMLPCLHAVSKAPVLPRASVPVSPPSPRSSSALMTAHCGSPRHQRYIQADLCLPARLCTHGSKHVTSDPLALGAIKVHCLSTPSLILILLYLCITLILLYLLHTQLPNQKPRSSDT